MIEAWKSGYFTYLSAAAGLDGPPWSLLLVPGWERLNGLPLPQVVAHQWATTIDVLVADLAVLPDERVRAVTYSEFLADPGDCIRRLTESVGIDWDRALDDQLPVSKTTVSKPAPEKWRG